VTTTHHRPSPELYTQIKLVCELMLKVHYFEPANWLWMTVAAPHAAQSKIAQSALADARTIAVQFGYPRVGKWVDHLLNVRTTAT